MKDEKRKKDSKRKGLGRLPVPVSRADVEAAFMARYASIGLGFGTSPEDMRAARAVCRIRAGECADVLDFLAR